MITSFLSLFSPYATNVTANQISIPLLAYSHIVPIVVAIAFGLFLFLKTKKLSAFYLFLLCVVFSIFAFFDVTAWLPNSYLIMFSWSILDVFSTGCFVLSYWFLYSFIKERDLSLLQKALTASALIPSFIIIWINLNISSFYVPTGIALDNAAVNNYDSILWFSLLLLIIIFIIVEYRKAVDVVSKNKIALAGIGVVAFLFIFFFSYVIINFIVSVNLWGLASNAYVYNLSIYSILGMPILLALLGYLIAKYQAFDMKLIKSIVYMVVLMALLFAGLFLV